MVKIEGNENWRRAFEIAIPKLGKRGMLEDLNAIKVATQEEMTLEEDAFPHDNHIGRYMSYEKEVLLAYDHPLSLSDKLYTIIHEVGHHLHFMDWFGDASMHPTHDEWEEHFFENADGMVGWDVEFVAEVFAVHHIEGSVGADMDEYESLGGPELSEPMFGEYERERNCMTI